MILSPGLESLLFTAEIIAASLATPRDRPRMIMPSNSIDSLLRESRQFPPDPEFSANAIAQPELYDRAAADRVEFWADQARELLDWHEPFTQTLDWSDAPFAKWFADGKINVAYNCLDRHVLAGNGERVAF